MPRYVVAMTAPQTPAPGPNLFGIILGATITLVGTFLVQLFVIPQVQAWTRGRERWENEMLGLVALLEEELPRSIRRRELANDEVRFFTKARDVEGSGREGIDALIQTAEKAGRDADEIVGEQMARLSVLIGRVRRLHYSSIYWGQLSFDHRTLQLAMWGVDIGPVGDPDLDEDERWRQTWASIDAARKSLLKRLKEVTDRIPMKPPRRNLVRRARWTISTRIENVRKRTDQRS